MAYPEKRPGGWTVRVKVGVHPDTGKDVYRRISKDPATGKPFPTKNTAKTYGQDLEAEMRAGTWVDPRRGETTWNQWWDAWITSQDIDDGTVVFYTSLYTNHIGPRWGDTPLGETRGVDITTWLKDLRDGTAETGPAGKRRNRKYGPRTTEGIRKQMRLMLDDAVAEAMLTRNVLQIEARSRMRGRRTNRVRPQTRPKLHVEPDDVIAIAVQLHGIAGPVAFVRTLLAGWTGLRPGEQAAIERGNCKSAERKPRIVVDEDKGAIREYAKGPVEFGPPKGGVGREVLLSPSLALLLDDWLKAVKMYLLPGPNGPVWRRREWNERWRIGCDGKHEIKRVGRQFETLDTWQWPPIVSGLEFKGLRRAHNVWLTEDGVPEVVRAHRLGHAMSDEMQAAYSLVSASMERELLHSLERRWNEAMTPEAWEIISQISPRLTEQRS